MSLAPGTRIGTFEILSLIGAGGMGEVYRARDARLGREVALKVLPEAFAADTDRVARFEREARTLAALNHPHIAQIHGLEDVPGDGGRSTRALVMELVEGEDLSERIARPSTGAQSVSSGVEGRGPLPVDEALAIARQIAEALEAAHAQGVVHRDLKPANVKVRADGTVKVLDFGLARAIDGPATGSGSLASPPPTITTPAMTQAGMILGTAAYMAPEQARGRAVDGRADLWAFGCVLYEMLTGHRAFDGEEVTDVLARVIEREPDWTRLPPATPGALRRMLRRLLQKDRAKRLQHAGDARLEIEEILSGASDEPPQPTIEPLPTAGLGRRALGYAATALLGAAIALAIGRFWGGPAVASRPAPVQFDIPMTAPQQGRFALSPDGRALAYLAPAASGRYTVWMRELAQASPDRMGDVDGATSVLWARDSSAVFADAAKGLHRFDVRSRVGLLQPARVPLVSVLGPGQFNRVLLPDGRVVIGATAVEKGSLRVWNSDGIHDLLPLTAAASEVRHGFPSWLGEGLIGYASVREDGSSSLCVTPVERPEPRCAGSLNQGSPAYFHDGRLIYTRGASLLARAFDPHRVLFLGDEQPVADGLSTTGSLVAAYLSASETGVVAFAVGDSRQRLVWVAPDRPEVVAAADLEATTNLALSPDGRRALVVAQGTLMTLDLATGGSSRLGPTGGDPIWAPDGNRLAYRSAAGIVTRSVDDPRETVLLAGALTGFPEDWSADGRWIAVGLRNDSFQIALVPVAGGEPVKLLGTNDGVTAADEMHFSPDGRWLAFGAGSGGRDEVFVVPLPPTGQRWQVSTAGGVQPRWDPKGRSLYYIDPTGAMMAVDIARGATFSAGVPRRLFDVGFIASRNFDDYRVGPDGRFLVKKRSATGDAAIRVIVNWPSLLPPRE